MYRTFGKRGDVLVNQEEIRANVTLAKYGNVDAFCKLYQLYYKDMYRFAYYILGKEQDAEDVISETVLDAFTGIKNLKQADKFKSWIFSILSTKCKRQLAVYATNKEHLAAECLMENVERADHPHDTNLDVRNAFKQLNDMEKMVVSLTVFGGYNSKETSKILNSKEGTVRSIKSRALDKMAQYLKEDYR